MVAYSLVSEEMQRESYRYHEHAVLYLRYFPMKYIRGDTPDVRKQRRQLFYRFPSRLGQTWHHGFAVVLQ
jgi:hypothetical protein